MSDVIMYGAAWCGDCTTAKRFMETHGYAYEYIDIDTTPGMAEKLRAMTGKTSVPTILFPDGRILVDPPLTDLKKEFTPQNHTNAAE
jgi:mycoredoxin